MLEILQKLNYQGKTVVVVTYDPRVKECAKRYIMLKANHDLKVKEAYIQGLDILRFTPAQRDNITRCVVNRRISIFVKEVKPWGK